MARRRAGAALALALAACIALPTAAAPPPREGAEFITLGTMGGPLPNPTRAQPANLLRTGGHNIVIDIGDGAVGQLARAGVPATGIDAVIISHLHFDHMGGLLALLGLYQQIAVERELTIYGPPGTRRMVEGLLAAMQPAAEVGPGLPGYVPRVPGALVKTVELSDGDSFSLGTARVTVAANTHYSFPEGSAEARRFQSLSLRFDLPDRSIVYTGDTGPSAAVERLAKGVDLLICEIVDVDAAMASLRKARPAMTDAQLAAIRPHFADQHLTAEEIGKLGARTGAKHIVITHNPGSGPEVIPIIRRWYAGPVTIANDLDRF
ncbi:metal-dependent hydrolase [Sphingobium jiangsuense]|uniref:Ribonuclease BN (tRNA processing enzyme) n=1 Tax=Sphingobium jiangsuense TaxID=870476 RepID=A0A7W6BJ19_9SPHN|nr:MBL fold metallo-hydrolase [Sphingobium jiangsuense]MBB3925971.1 ribonuclease BN (tRNA processing enzyme) [Sphingobium jiangsuense]GLS98904.1 metal-dependent hydrolase [Sphingobium jiangsuense]